MLLVYNMIGEISFKNKNNSVLQGLIIVIRVISSYIVCLHIDLIIICVFDVFSCISTYCIEA